MLCCVCGVLGHFAPVHRCARSACCIACAVSSATWLLLTGVIPRCVVLCLRWPVRRCVCSACCVGCAVSWATWLLFTGVPAQHVVLRVQCPRPLGSCSAKWPRAPHTQDELQSEHTGEQEPSCPGHRTGNTQHKAPSDHTGEQEPSSPERCTRKTTHRTGTPVNRSQVAQDTAHTTQHNERAHG